MEIRKAVVIGSGVMGGGIAAHIANAGVPVTLLDIVPKDGGDRNALAKGAIERLKKSDPAAFMHKGAARLVTPGNLEDDLGALSDADWIVEVVIENLDIKRALYAKIEDARKDGSVVSSNTSTIPLARLVEGQSDRFKADFVITHFFNPPRYMRLLEVVAGPDTRPAAVTTIRDFADHRLGKGVVMCHDTPGFIANRIGTFWIQAAMVHAVDMGLTVEEADAALGRPWGIPKTGAFALVDLVGLDLIPMVAKSMHEALPKDDGYNRLYRSFPLVDQMIADGYTGRKGKGGFYRLNREGGKRVKEAIDLQTGAYRVSEKAQLDSVAAARKSPRAMMEHPDIGGRYARKVMGETLAYAAALVPEIADAVPDVDEAMRLGYGWKKGPFELIDDLGAAWFAEALAADGQDVPALLKTVGDGTFYREHEDRLQFLTLDGTYADLPRPDGVLLLSDIKRGREPLLRNGSASLWDIGDGVCCLEFHSKMNAIDDDTMTLIGKATKLVAKDHKALVIHNEGTHFSVGANIGLALFAANLALWPNIEELVSKGQKTYKALKYAPFPVVGAPSGMALGGGCEILLHCDAVQAHAETYTGLVEVGVGIIPGWGGCKEMLTRWATSKKRPGGAMPVVSQAFETIGLAKVAKSAAEAQELLYFRETDRITMNRDRVLADAKARALELAEGYAVPEPIEISLPGPAAETALTLAVDGLRLQGKATPHDEVVSGFLAKVLSGGDTDVTETVTEDQLLKLERDSFMKLVRTEDTLARMEHMMTTGKPLRN